ncbi:MAG: hypothetical protein HND47_10960 [Chloroflexi bacterium]|nr:hypothetical protein [Chloroflexota bacterium]
MSQLACLGTQMPPQNIQLVSFPAELFKQTRTFDPVFDKRISILAADFDVLREYVAQFHAGTWPPAVTDDPTGEEEDTPIVCE